MESEKNLEFQLGNLTGQINALIVSLNAVQATVSALDARLREQEKHAVKVATGIGVIGVIAGGVGTLIMDLFVKKLP